MNNGAKVYVGMRGKDFILRIEGKASWNISHTVKLFEERYSSEIGTAGKLFFDLSDCTSIDSTIIGLVCHLAVRYMKTSGSKAVAWINHERVWGVFELMNCDRIIDTQPLPDSGVGNLLDGLTELTVEASDTDSLRATMLAAHTALSELNSNNEAQFADVIDDLKKGPQSGKH